MEKEKEKEKENQEVSEADIEELLNQFGQCKDCRSIIMTTCCRKCSQCKAGLCNSCEVICSHCPRSMCKDCSQEVVCIECGSQICGFCAFQCHFCPKVLCGHCKSSCSQCKAKGCPGCVSLRSCELCGRLQCIRCRVVCPRCHNEICSSHCQQPCPSCKVVYCLHCLSQCQCREWVLEQSHNSNVVLSQNRLSVWASEDTSEESFVVRGLVEFKQGVHQFNVLVERLQPDCAGCGFGVATLNDFLEWQPASIYAKHIAKYLVGMTANGAGLSPTVTGLHTGLSEGHTYTVRVDRLLQELRISGPGTDITTLLEPDQVYIPVFTRCHGSYRITVQHGL